MKIDFNESDLLKEILNFKIVNKKDLLEKYGFKNIKNINKFLQERNTGIIHASKNYLYYFGKYDENIFKIESKDIKKTFRRDLISFILLFGKEKLNIYNFNKQIKKPQENKRNIQNDLKQILEIFNIKYSEYVKSENIEKLFEEKNSNFKEFKENYLKEILCRRLEKIYIGKSTYQENFYFKIMQETLKIKNVSKTVKNENFLVMMEKIFKREKLEMNPKFILTFYKKLHRKRNNAENVINKINRELSLQNDENLKIKKSAEQDKIEFYDIAESSINFENKNFPSKQIIKKYVDLDKVQKISTLILVDLEEKEILKVYNKVSKIFNFINIVKVERLDKFKKIITKNNDEFEQILLISSSKFISIIKNYSEIPIYHFEIENEKGALKNKNNFLKQMIHLRTMMIQYLEFKKERRIFPKRIKRQ